MVTGPITVRAATAEDIPFMQAMIWEAILASPNHLARYGVETMRQLEEQYWRRWAEHADPAFVAVDAGGRKLGAITVKPDTDEPVRGWRVGIGVEAEARGQSVGYLLIERAIAFAREKGAAYVSLFVDRTNARAIALYRRTGFAEVGERDGVMEMCVILNETGAS